MHRVLQRQLEEVFGAEPPSDPQLVRLLELIDAAYQRSDTSQEEVTRALRATSHELQDRNHQLEQELVALTTYEQALADSRVELQEVLATLPDHVWLVDAQGRLVDPRPRLPSALSDQLVTAGQIRAHARAALTKSKLEHWEFSVDVGDEHRLFEGRCLPGATSKCVVLVRDITDLRAMQRQLGFSEHMASVGAMASSVAHEVNSPLTTVIANLDHVAEELKRLDRTLNLLEVTDAMGALDEAKAGAQRVARIVRDLQVFASPMSGERSACDLNQIVDSALNVTASQIRHRARIIRETGKLPLLRADSSRLGQALINLLLNAAQAIEPGQADANSIRVTTCTTDQWLEILIQDSGEGVKEEHLPRIFEPFFSTKQFDGCTGLGLSICRKIVDEHGGRLLVESTRGVGTLVKLQLPLKRAGVDTVPPPRPATASSSETARILIIDDEPEVARAMGRALRDHAVTLVHDGAAGLDQMRSQRFDLVICDLMMPQMTGMEVFQRVSSDIPSQLSRLVFMTGGAFSDAGHMFLTELTNEYLEKPFDQARLRSFVERQLERVASTN